jgi:DNA-binding PadR family transcriptional regulator
MGMRGWTEIGFSSIYYLLKKLEREDENDQG